MITIKHFECEKTKEKNKKKINTFFIAEKLTFSFRFTLNDRKPYERFVQIRTQSLTISRVDRRDRERAGRMCRMLHRNNGSWTHGKGIKY